MIENNVSRESHASHGLSILERFEQAWRSGGPPDLALFLPVPASESDLLVALIQLDLQYRLEAGEPARVEDYRRRFSVLAEDDNALRQLILAEYQLRRRREPGPPWSEYQARFPQVKDDPEPARGPAPAAAPDSFPTISYDPHRTVAQDAPYSPSPELLAAAQQPWPQVPGYEILGVLGKGGMGIVYRARQVDLKRPVALKMIRTGAGADVDELARFQTEAEAVARLQHPGIVQIFEIGLHQGAPFFCLELVAGGSLAGKLNATPQPAQESARLVETLARAMDHAHQHGIVHRDLKPHNVLLTDDGAPKISDFGLAKKLDAEEGHTQTGAILGTPSYMAPEQAGGLSKEIGPPADVYALGAILYEMLTGRPPFKGTSPWDTIKQVLYTEAVPPTRLRAGIPRDLETVCLKCLQKDPSRRYGTARELAEDLARFQAGKPIQARPVPAWERLLKWARRERAKAALLGVSVVVFLIVIGGVIAGLAVKNRFYSDELARLDAHNKACSSSRQRLKLAKEQVDKGQLQEANHSLDAASDFLVDQQDSEVDELRAEIDHLRAVVAEGRIVTDRLRAFQKPDDDAHFRVTEFTGQNMAENQARAIASARAALAIWALDGDQDWPEGQPPRLERARLILGDAEHARLTTACYELFLIWAEAVATPPPGWPEPQDRVRSRAETALRLLDRAEQLAQAHDLNTRAFHKRKARYLACSKGIPFDPAQIDPRAPARPQGALDWFLEGLDHYQEGTRALQERRHPGASFLLASAACQEALKKQDNHYWARYVLALCHLRAESWGNAKMEFMFCIRSRPEQTWPRLLHGYAAIRQGAAFKSPEQAKTEFEQAEEDFRFVLETDHDPLAQYVGLANRAALNVLRQRWEDAVKDLQQAVKLNEKGFQGYLDLSQALQGLKRWDEALIALNEAIKQAPDLALLYEQRAKLHLERNDRRSARQDFERAIAKEPAGDKSERLVKNLVELGRIQIRDHDYKEAEATLDRALKLNPRYVLAQRYRAEALLGQNRHAEAGQAIDEYLKADETPSAEIWKARGLIHAATGQLSKAIDCYSAALQREPEDAEALHFRGWAYLLIDANQLALTDFEAGVKKNPNDAEALVGRGSARIRLKQLEDALQDANRAEQLGPLTDRLLYNVACIYAQAVAQLRAETTSSRSTGTFRRLPEYEKRALRCLTEAVAKLPAEKQAGFWRNKVETDPALVAIRRGEQFERLAQRYRPAGR